MHEITPPDMFLQLPLMHGRCHDVPKSRVDSDRYPKTFSEPRIGDITFPWVNSADGRKDERRDVEG
jgi:hypothetical protein